MSPRDAIVVLTVDQLRDLVTSAVRDGCQAVLAQAAVTPPGKAWLSPREVRVMARCSMNTVFADLNAGALKAERVSQKAGTKIAAFTWRIARADAERYVSALLHRVKPEAKP